MDGGGVVWWSMEVVREARGWGKREAEVDCEIHIRKMLRKSGCPDPQ
jgi:hypothetical protein